MPDPWNIVDRGFDAASAKPNEGLFTLGSGYLHVRGSLEEHFPDQPQNVAYVRRATNVTSERFREGLAQWGTYIPGVFAPHPTLHNEMVNLPWPLELAPEFDGDRLDVRRPECVAHERTLSLRDATLRRSVRWRSGSGAIVDIEFERFVSAARPHLVVQRMRLLTDRPCALRVHAGIEADVRTNGHDHFRTTHSRCDADGTLACEVTTDGGDCVALRSLVRIDPAEGLREAILDPTHPDRRCRILLSTNLEPKRPFVVEKRTWIATSRDREWGDAARPTPTACAAAARDGLAGSAASSYGALLAEHSAEWADRWQAADVEIEGDPRSQLALRTAVFHLLRAHTSDDRVAIDAKGFAGEAYWGRFFWDTETYLLPFYLYTRPDCARSLVDFRVRTLPGARRNAQRYGYAGARYAWESDHHGDECCPNWQYADHEVHVSADVAFGIAHLAAALGEAEIDGARARVLVETARYWMDRITFAARPSHSDPRILGVMGPDEYKPITNDNAYTNRLVSHALATAARHGPRGGATPEEIAAWITVSMRLPIPRDASGELVLQCDGFDSFAEPEFDRFWIERSATFAAQVSQERLYRSKCLKQADVLLLMALFPGDFTDAEVRRAWDYYLPYTTHDSSLSCGAHCLVACRLGLARQAWEFWLRGSGLDLPVADGGGGGAAEGIHIAAAGAAWQMAVFGFAGVRTALQSEELVVEPRLPTEWRALRFPLLWKGQPTRIAIEGRKVTVENRSARPLAAVVRGERRVIEPHSLEIIP